MPLRGKDKDNEARDLKHLADLACLVDVGEANAVLLEQLRRRVEANRNLVEHRYLVDVDICAVIEELEGRGYERQGVGG